MPCLTADLRAHLQTTLGSAYTLERELGGGGMSRVFLAHETALGRRIVLKVLSPDVAQELSAERFEREIRVSARLQHPNIVPVLAAGIAGGIPYYTMPYVEGESLRARLARGERLSPDAAVSLLRDVARALAYAHERGVVHRDIKPDNVLLSDDAVVVADFGIAKALSVAKLARDSEPKPEPLTQLGTALGTPAYMAPEQAVGDPGVDHRADLYAWGVMAYELLAGRHPFDGKLTPQALITAHLVEQPAPLANIGGIPPSLSGIVMRCLAKDPDDRPATAREVVDALSATRLTPASPVPAVALPTGPTVSAPSVAVLPFANPGGNADDEYFSDGMTDEAINALAHLPGLRVAARTSSFAFKGQRADLRAIAEQLRVATVLEGSVRRSGTRVRISVQLISAADGLHLWGERYDRELSDVFALQDDIASAIATALREHFGGTARTTPSERTIRAAVEPKAYDSYLRGRFLFERFAPLDALASFERAIELDPGFALAHAWSGLAVMLAANLHVMPSRKAYPRGKAEGEKALRLEPRLAEGHLVGAIHALWYDRDLQLAETRAREAVAIAPGMPHAHEFVAWSLVARHRFDEGIPWIEKAYSLDPLSDFMALNLVIMYVFAGLSSRAIESLRPALARSPENGGLHWALGLALFTADRPHEARTAFERSRELLTITNRAPAGLSCALAALGDVAGARRMLDEAKGLAEDGRGSAAEVAIAYHWIGDDDQAFEWLDRAFADHEMWVTFLHVDPRLERLRGTPRFDALMHRIGVAPRDASATGSRSSLTPYPGGDRADPPRS